MPTATKYVAQICKTAEQKQCGNRPTDARTCDDFIVLFPPPQIDDDVSDATTKGENQTDGTSARPQGSPKSGQ